MADPSLAMKVTHALAPVLLATAGLFGGHAASQAERAQLQDDKGTLAERVEQLESQVSELTARLDRVAADAAEQRTTTETAVDYLRRQAAQSKKLLGVFDESEEGGFTAGINPRSREVLLEGWRAAANEAQVGLPGEEPPAPTPVRGRR